MKNLLYLELLKGEEGHLETIRPLPVRVFQKQFWLATFGINLGKTINQNY
jgi:hypothetical protein